MEKEFTHTDLMDRYLRHQLDAAEQSDFEQRLRDDPAFAAEWDAFRDTVTAIKLHGEQELRKTILQVQKKLEAEQFFTAHKPTPAAMKKQTFFRMILAAAAAITLIAVATYLYSPTPIPSPEQYAQFEKPNMEQVAKILDRLEAPGFADPDKGRNDSLASALRLYLDGKWEDARVELAQFCKIYPDDKIARHYLGMSLMQQGEYAKAASHLSTLTNDADFELRYANKWYLAQCYARFGTRQGFKDARTLMQQLADDPDSGYSKEAKEYIRQILKKS